MSKTKQYHDATRETLVAAIEAEHIDPAVMVSLLEWAGYEYLEMYGQSGWMRTHIPNHRMHQSVKGA
jgi:hypothetical protein